MIDLYIGTKFIGHDSSIFIIDVEKKEVFGINEERLTRYKHDRIPPLEAIKKYLEYKNISVKDIKNVYISHSFKEQLKNKKINKHTYELELYLRKIFNKPYIKDFKKAFDEYQKLPKFQKLIKKSTNKYAFLYIIKSKIFKEDVNYEEFISYTVKKVFPYSNIKVNFYNHQLCHNISSYYSSPYEKCLGISIDGEGDFEFSSVYEFDKGSYKKLFYSKTKKIKTDLREFGFTYELTTSVGHVYTVFTWLLGFTPIADEGKVEALAAFGEHNNGVYKDLKSLVTINKEKLSIDISKEKSEKLFQYENLQKYLQKYKKEDIAAAVQRFLEDVVVEYVQLVVEKTGIRKICLSGGVSANVIMNLNIFEKVTKDIFIVPAMADDGTAQGAAILTLLDNGYKYEDLKWLKKVSMPYWGTSYTKDEVLKELEKWQDKITYKDLGNDWPEITAKMLVDGKIGAIFHGRMEWGPRALGNRSIIANVKDRNIHKKMNLEIKRRPEFQPFCPSILAEEKDRLFTSVYLNKHMTTACRIKDEFRDEIPGSVHVDGTARAQFVEEYDNPNYYRLLKKVKELTGFGVVINTSFNKHGRTIVESPKDAIVDFIDTDMDYLVIEGILVERR